MRTHAFFCWGLGLVLLTITQRAGADITSTTPYLQSGTGGNLPDFYYYQNGTPPISWTLSGGGNGVTAQETFDSSYSFTTVGGGPVISQTELDSESMSLSVGGDSPAGSPQSASIHGYFDVTSYVDRSGPDEYFYAFQSGLINYQLAQGDKLEYSVYAGVYWNGYNPNYPYYYSVDNTVSTPGSGSLNIDVPLTYVFDLYSINNPWFQSFFYLSATITRGDSSVGDSSIEFDPGLSVAGSSVPQSVPEPSSLLPFALGLVVIGYVRVRGCEWRCHRA